MPADIVGTNIIVEDGAASGGSSFQRGPDLRQPRPRRRDQPRHARRRRAPLLEAMQEHRVTVAKQQLHARPSRSSCSPPRTRSRWRAPTRCPRRSSIGSSSSSTSRSRRDEELIAILERTTGADGSAVGKVAVAARDVLAHAAAGARGPDRPARAWPTRSASCAARTRTPSTSRRTSCSKYVRYGGSPRGAQAMRARRQDPRAARRPLQRRLRATCRRSPPPALRHRVILNFEGEAEGISTDSVVRVDHRRDAHRACRVADRRPRGPSR